MQYRFLNTLYCGIVFLLTGIIVYAKKPDAALPPDVWKIELELLASLDSTDGWHTAQTYLKLAQIFKDNERELTYLNLAEKYAASENYSELSGTINLMRLEHYAIYEDTGIFLKCSEDTKNFMLANNDIRVANVEHIIIKRHIDEGRIQTALNITEKMLKRATSEKNIYMEAYAYFSIGLIYEAADQFYEAAESLEKSIRLMMKIEEQFPRIDLIKAYLEILSVQCSIGRHAESIKSCSTADRLLSDYIEENSDFQEEANRRSMRIYILCYLARNYIALNNTDLALYYIKQAKDCIYPSIGHDVEIFHETSAIYYKHTGEYDKALEYAEKSVNAFRNNQLFPYYLEALELKTNILAAKGEWNNAYNNLRFISHAKDSLDASRFARELSELHTIYEVDKIEAQKKRQQTILLLSLACCLLLIIIIIVYIAYSQRLKIKNQSLYEQIRSNLKNENNSTKVLRMTPEDRLSKEMRLFRKIAVMMEEEHPFIEPSFSRFSIAKRMGTNDKYIADAVRAGTGATVATYISNLRLGYSLTLLMDEECYSLDYIAINSGFGSYSSFFRAFQKKYSMSPSEYRNYFIRNGQTII